MHLGDVLAGNLQRILQSGCRDDGGAVLVVVHDGDVERALQPFLDGETLRRLDVFEVDAAERRGNLLHRLAELVGVFLVDLNVEDVDTAVDLEQQSLAFHDRLAAHGTDVAQSQYGSTVGDDRHEVALVGVFVDVVGVLLNLQTGERHPRRVGEGEVCLRTIRLGGFHLNLSWASGCVVFQSCFFRYLYHNYNISF